MRLMLASLACGLLAATQALAGSTIVTGDDITTVLEGECKDPTFIAEGMRGEDLTRKQSRFFCDSAVMTSFGDRPGHLMFQFASKQSHHSNPVGFAGQLKDKDFLDVRAVYLETGKSLPRTDGGCKLFWKGSTVTNIICMGVVDEGAGRTVAGVSFAVKAGQ